MLTAVTLRRLVQVEHVRLANTVTTLPTSLAITCLFAGSKFPISQTRLVSRLNII